MGNCLPWAALNISDLPKVFSELPKVFTLGSFFGKL
jgi:hypothetical protein